MPLISKTTFLQFQMCPKDTWLMLHKPKLVAQFKPTEFELHLMEQGNEVEGVARETCRPMRFLSPKRAKRRAAKPSD